MVGEGRFPDIHSLSKVVDRALWVLSDLKGKGRAYLSAREIAEQLTDLHKIATRPNAVRMALERAPRGFVHVKGGIGGKIYEIMKSGEDHLAELEAPGVLLIEPERAYTSRRKVDELLKKWAGVIKICDPYLDPKTFDPLTAIPKGSQIRLLTKNVFETSRVRREIEAYRKEYSFLEVRVCQDNLHDRYVIVGDKLWLFGHSLNGLGKKEAFIVGLGSDIRLHMEPVFDKRWANSPALC